MHPLKLNLVIAYKKRDLKETTMPTLSINQLSNYAENNIRNFIVYFNFID